MRAWCTEKPPCQAEARGVHTAHCIATTQFSSHSECKHPGRRRVLSVHSYLHEYLIRWELRCSTSLRTNWELYENRCVEVEPIHSQFNVNAFTYTVFPFSLSHSLPFLHLLICIWRRKTVKISKLQPQFVVKLFEQRFAQSLPTSHQRPDDIIRICWQRDTHR